MVCYLSALKKIKLFLIIIIVFDDSGNFLFFSAKLSHWSNIQVNSCSNGSPANSLETAVKQNKTAK